MVQITTWTSLPFVTTASFAAHPTFLDLNNLRSGDSSLADQTDELNNILLMASNWANDFCRMPLHAHTQVENGRIRPDRWGRLFVYPDHKPVRSVSSIAWGYTIGGLNVFTNPTVFVEDGAMIIYQLSAAGYSWSGPLQFGVPVGDMPLYVTTTYVAGYANTILTANAAQAATSISVQDPTGILPGDVMRIWEPGKEEAITVSSAYVQGANPVTLASGLANAHTSGAGVSAFPAEVHLAVINYAVASLMRPDTTAEDEFPDTPIGPSTRGRDPRRDGSGLVAEAMRLLGPYRDIR